MIRSGHGHHRPLESACRVERCRAAVAKVLKRIGTFYVFLREVRHELFDAEFQAELAAAYLPRGTSPLPAALLAMVTLLQAYDQTGDADAVVTAQMDKRWQLVLDCLGADEAPFSQGVLSQFRARMIEHDRTRRRRSRWRSRSSASTSSCRR